MSHSRAVVFIDPAIAGWEDIAASAGHARVVVLDDEQDGLLQIAAALAAAHIGQRGHLARRLSAQVALNAERAEH